MSTEDNKTLYRRLLEEVMNQRNLVLVDELCAPDFVYHCASTTMVGREPFKQFLSIYLTASPGLHFTIEDQVADQDKIVTCYTGRGTHLEPFIGIPPNRKARHSGRD